MGRHLSDDASWRLGPVVKQLSVVGARLDRATQYSRDGSAKQRSRGVLDRPPSRTMTLKNIAPPWTNYSGHASTVSRHDVLECCTVVTLPKQEGAGNAG
jgi:hypothetical protein